jgi:hypothetical protein
MTTTAADVRLAARNAMAARENAGDSLELLYVAIVRAYGDGVPVPTIADAARLSRARVYQVLSDHAVSVATDSRP